MDSMERTTGECQSPRISFSLNLSQNDRIAPENRKREDVADVHYDTDFEFCVVRNSNYRHSFFEGALSSVADELFADGKILPVDRPIEAQHVSLASPLDLESSRCQSQVRSASHSPEITSSFFGSVSSKSSRQKPPSKWKEIMLKLSNRENPDSGRTSSKIADQDRSGINVKKQPLLPFPRSCSTGNGAVKGNGLFDSLPFFRSHSTVRNLERPNNSAAKAASLYSPRRGKPMVKSNPMGGARVSPVLNVTACIGIHHVGGSWNGSSGLFGFFHKREQKQSPAYYTHHSHASTKSKKGA